MERRIPEPLDGLGVLVRRRFLLGLAGGSAFDNEPRNFHQSSNARQQIALRAGAGAGVREHSHLSIWTSGLTPSHRDSNVAIHPSALHTWTAVIGTMGYILVVIVYPIISRHNAVSLVETTSSLPYHSFLHKYIDSYD